MNSNMMKSPKEVVDILNDGDMERIKLLIANAELHLQTNNSWTIGNNVSLLIRKHIHDEAKKAGWVVSYTDTVTIISRPKHLEICFF